MSFSGKSITGIELGIELGMYLRLDRKLELSK